MDPHKAIDAAALLERVANGEIEASTPLADTHDVRQLLRVARGEPAMRLRQSRAAKSGFKLLANEGMTMPS
jgi:hypothetical protein